MSSSIEEEWVKIQASGQDENLWRAIAAAFMAEFGYVENEPGFWAKHRDSSGDRCAGFAVDRLTGEVLEGDFRNHAEAAIVLRLKLEKSGVGRDDAFARVAEGRVARVDGFSAPIVLLEGYVFTADEAVPPGLVELEKKLWARGYLSVTSARLRRVAARYKKTGRRTHKKAAS